LVLVFGTRLALFGAGIGALLGFAILGFLPGTQESLWWLILPAGLAILFAMGTGLAKGVISIITLALGALAGGAIILATLSLFGLDFGLLNWVLALVGAVIGAVLLSRFKNWTLIVLASIVGALITVHGLGMLVPVFQGFLGTLTGLLLTGGGIAYHSGFIGKKKSNKP
jgi:hypothetical protein